MSIIAKFRSGEPLTLTPSSYPAFKSDLMQRFAAAAVVGRGRSVSPLAALGFNYADYTSEQKSVLTGVIHKSWVHICHVLGNSTSETNARVLRSGDFNENNHLMREWAGRFPGMEAENGTLLFTVGLTDAASVLAASIRLLHLTDWPTKFMINFQSNTLFKWATFDAITKGQRGLENAHEYVVTQPVHEQPVIIPPRSITPPPSMPDAAIMMPTIGAPVVPVVPAPAVPVGTAVAVPIIENTAEPATDESTRLPRRTRCAVCNQLPDIRALIGGACNISCGSPGCQDANRNRPAFVSQRDAIIAWNSEQRSGDRPAAPQTVADERQAMVNSIMENMRGIGVSVEDVTVDMGNGNTVSLSTGSVTSDLENLDDEGDPILSNDEEEV